MMGVDQPGIDDLSRGVNDGVGVLVGNVRPDGFDFLSFDEQASSGVAAALRVHGDNVAGILDQQCVHAKPPFEM
ncbi:hypothetical protein D3C85_1510010 [compost metagenome]